MTSLFMELETKNPSLFMSVKFQKTCDKWNDHNYSGKNKLFIHQELESRKLDNLTATLTLVGE